MKNYIVFLSLAVLCGGCSRPDMDARKADRWLRFSDRAHHKAVFYYERALAVMKPGARRDKISYQLGRLFFEAGDYEAALGILKGLASFEARFLLAQALFKTGDDAGALEVFHKIGDKGDAEFLYRYGLVLEKNNLYDQAQRLYSRITRDARWGALAKERLAAMNLARPAGAYSGVSEEVRQIVVSAPGQEAYPDASAIILLADEAMALSKDDQLTSDVHYVVKILNERGKEAYGEISLPYDATYEKLELAYARTIKPDGTVVTVGDKNIRDVSLYLNYPLYSNVRARIISMPEVAVGAVIEYKARLVQTKLPNKKDFDVVFWLQTDEPILRERFRVTVPRDRQLATKIVNSLYNTFGYDMNPVVTEQGSSRVYQVFFERVPQIIPEPAMPPGSRINPYILFSSFSSWQDVYLWWRALAKDKAAADEAIRAKALLLAQGQQSVEDKIRAIYNFCAQDIRYVAVEYGDAGYEPHSAAEIFANKYGDCKDKVILLLAMLDAVGIQAYPVLISTQDSLDLQKDVPSLVFNHAIAAVKVADKLVFMDATASTVPWGSLPPGDQDRDVLVFFPDHYEILRTPASGPGENRILTELRLKVADDKSVSAERLVTARGVYEHMQRYWLRYTMPSLVEEELKQKVRSFADNAVLTGYKISGVEDLDTPIALSYTFTAPRYLTQAAGTYVVDKLGALDTTPVFAQARRYPIEESCLKEKEDVIDIELPGHLAVKYLPKPVSVQTPWFDLKSAYEVVPGHGIRFRFFHRVKQRVLAVDEYPAFKKAVEESAAEANQHVILEETRRQDGRTQKK